MKDDLDYNILQVIPYLLVLITAIIGINVFIVLISGTVLSVIVGIATGAMAPSAVFTSIGTGVTNMYDITVISILVAAISALVKQNGGFAFILEKIHNHVHTYKGAGIRCSSPDLPGRRCHGQQHGRHRHRRSDRQGNQRGLRHRTVQERIPFGHVCLGLSGASSHTAHNC